MTVRKIEAPQGTARAYLATHVRSAARGLILGHGAGRGVEAPDLVTTTDAARSEGSASRSSSSRGASLAGALRRRVAARCRLDRGRREPTRERAKRPPLGAAVACRTAEATDAVAVLCLAFPLEPPRRAGKPRQRRLAELDAVTVPMLVVRGDSDLFGMPPPAADHKSPRSCAY